MILRGHLINKLVVGLVCSVIAFFTSFYAKMRKHAEQSYELRAQINTIRDAMVVIECLSNQS